MNKGTFTGKNNCLWIIDGIIISLICVLSGSLFFNFIVGKFSSDFVAHISTVISGNKGYSLAHLIIKICSLSGHTNEVLTIVMVVIIACTIGASYIYVYGRLNSILDSSVILFVAISSIFVNSLYVPVVFPYFYTHYTVVSQPWHNITYLVMRLWSIGVLCLWFEILNDIQMSKKLRARYLLLFLVLLIMCNWSKPNFVLAFAPMVAFVFIHVLLVSHGKSIRSVLLVSLMGILSMVPVFFQTRVVFDESEKASIVISAENFVDYLFGNVQGNFLIYEFCNLLFPMFVLITLLYLHFGKKNNIDFSRITCAFLMFVISHLQQLFLAEDGPRKLDGNFAWGVYGMGMLLYLIIITEWIYIYKTKNINKIVYMVGNVIYCWHVFGG
ncbi:hypothetical protein [Butyrivibrio sp. VCB2006]|uniref:hypothetical protein n=1 Tax=Butyrivibrio sp. VCB2006 TaxID=1280679 RepID=UPI0003FA7828|nr:hypothetical protein [Butyrivibrio sp. VCB2006]